MSSIADELRAARDLIKTPAQWTKEVFARDAKGVPVDSQSPDAVCFCAEGALEHVDAHAEASEAIEAVVKCKIVEFNERPKTTHKAVLRAFDTAIKNLDEADAVERYAHHVGPCSIIECDGVHEARLARHLNLAVGTGATRDEAYRAFWKALQSVFSTKTYLTWAATHPEEDALERARHSPPLAFHGPMPAVCECSEEHGPCEEALACIDDHIEAFLAAHNNGRDESLEWARSNAYHALRKHRDAAHISRDTMDRWAAPWWKIAWDREAVCT